MKDIREIFAISSAPKHWSRAFKSFMNRVPVQNAKPKDLMQGIYPTPIGDRNTTCVKEQTPTK